MFTLLIIFTMFLTNLNSPKVSESSPYGLGYKPLAVGLNLFMKQIPLTQGLFALVDDEDYNFLMQWKWHAAKHKNGIFYAKRGLKINKISSTIFMHRLLMNNPIDMLIDHKDQNGLNNQKSNLRICDHRQNRCNSKPKKNGTSKYIGVTYHAFKVKSSRKENCKIYVYHRYMAAINIKGNGKTIGYFKNEDDAALAYNKFAIKYHGEFAKLNIIK